MAKQFKVVIQEIWHSTHIVDADTKDEAIELADLTDDWVHSCDFVTSENGIVSVERVAK